MFLITNSREPSRYIGELSEIAGDNLRFETIDGDSLRQCSTCRSGHMVERAGPANRRFLGCSNFPNSVGDLCGTKGRFWLSTQVVPEDERLAIDRHLREFDRLGEDLQVIERDLARSALEDEGVKRLMTIPGVDMTVALAMKAAIGDVSRFDEPQKLVSYLGLNPSVRQSGPGPAYHGRITKQGRGHARGMLVEAAWAAARAPGPLRAFFLRVRARRGQHVAAVATARKLAVVIWHLLMKGESYAWARPSLYAKKLRDMELKAGHKAARGQKGAAHAYNIKSHREEERRWVEQAEGAYARFVAGWNSRGPKKARTDAANEVRR